MDVLGDELVFKLSLFLLVLEDVLVEGGQFFGCFVYGLEVLFAWQLRGDLYLADQGFEVFRGCVGHVDLFLQLEIVSHFYDLHADLV